MPSAPSAPQSQASQRRRRSVMQTLRQGNPDQSQPSQPAPHMRIPARQDAAKKNAITPRLGMREWYAAGVIGIAAFIIGLIMWPGAASQRVTVAVVQLELDDQSAMPEEAMQSTMARLRSTCCDDSRIAAIAESLDELDKKADPAWIASIQDRLRLRLVPALIHGKSVWQIEVKLIGKGTELETQLVDRIASDLALAWQQELLNEVQQQQVQFAENRILNDRQITEELTERVDRASALQWDAIQSALAELESASQTADDTMTDGLDEGPGLPGASQDEPVTSFNGPRIDLQDFHPIREPGDRQDAEPESGLTENPQWLMLANEKARLEWLIEKLKRQNHWTSAHPEISSLSNDLQLVTRQLTRVERFVVDESAISEIGGSQFEENEYAARGTADRDSLAAETASYQPAANLDTDEIRASLQAPLEELRRDLEGLGAQIDDSSTTSQLNVDPIESLSLATPFLAQPASMQMITSTRGTIWRLGLIGCFSAVFGLGVTWTLQRNHDSSLVSTRDIERELGLPVVGVLGNTTKTKKSFLHSIKSVWVVRSAEAMVAVTIGMLFLAVAFDPRLAIDLAENPLLTVSDILGSLMRS